MNDITEEKRGETLKRILEASRHVFAEKGFSGARVDEIAKRAGVNKATLYYHVGDKRALYAEALHNTIGTAAQRIMEGLRESKSPEDMMKKYLKILADTFDENPQVPRMMMRELASGGQNLPDIFFQDLFSILKTLSSIIEEGKSKGVFSDTLPLLVHFMAIGATVIYKIIAPILKTAKQLPEGLKELSENVSGEIAGEIEKLILKAIKN